LEELKSNKSTPKKIGNPKKYDYDQKPFNLNLSLNLAAYTDFSQEEKY